MALTELRREKQAKLDALLGLAHTDGRVDPGNVLGGGALRPAQLIRQHRQHKKVARDGARVDRILKLPAWPGRDGLAEFIVSLREDIDEIDRNTARLVGAQPAATL